MRRSAEDSREHLLEVARSLFLPHGVRATGVDTIVAEAGVAPTTLYRAFRDKNDLVDAYVEREAERYQQWWVAITGRLGSPQDRLNALFEAIGEQILDEDCVGCPFQLTLAELRGSQLPATERATRLKSWTRSRLVEMVVDLDRADAGPPDDLADQLLVIIEGMYAAALSTPRPAVARSGVTLLTRLVEEHVHRGA